MENIVYHVPIMVSEVMNYIKPECRNIIVDGTLGGGGHTTKMFERMPNGGILIGIDRDIDAIKEASSRIESLGIRTKKFKASFGNFFDAKELLRNEGVTKVDAMLLDLGVSSHQFNCAERGFSHRFEAKLDMRMNQSDSLSAYDIVNNYDEKELNKIIRDYGEERYAKSIARAIADARKKKPIQTTFELVEIIKSVMPMKELRKKGNPSSKTFQALRIATNQELKGLDKAIESAVDLLNPGGVLVVITFHSLEDRIVKNVFRTLNNPCTCDPKSPICTCGKEPVVELLNRKPLIASEREVEENPRARSAKLRAVRKLVNN